MRTWNATNGKTGPTLTGHTDPVKAVAVTPDGQWQISGGDQAPPIGRPNILPTVDRIL